VLLVDSAVPKPPQIWRQMSAARSALLLAFPFFLIVTALVVFSRRGASSGDLSLILPLPLLAALGVLPVASPSFIFFLEVLGTARILTTIHPFAKLSANGNNNNNNDVGSRTILLIRYTFATALSRLSLWGFARSVQDCCFSGFRELGDRYKFSDLLRVPPASLNLLEKLGVATAFALVDDELACEPHAIPQQLLIPSGEGLKLLDLCPMYDDDESKDDSASDTGTGRKYGKSFDSDSESEDGAQPFHSSLRQKVLRRRRIRQRRMSILEHSHSSDLGGDPAFEVQFEDPLWWQYLPTLKGIGLSCLVVDASHENRSSHRQLIKAQTNNINANGNVGYSNIANGDSLKATKTSLVDLVSNERRTFQLKALADCIGFSTDPNSFGTKGDLSPFVERVRLLIMSNLMFRERLQQDSHERSSENSRWWGLVRPDAYSVIVEDQRSMANQLLTVGDPLVVTTLCNEAWQGEISTILPLTGTDRATILETSKNWKLADLDVVAFSYSPVSRVYENLLQASNANAILIQVRI
jgi:hypothetical protein